LNLAGATVGKEEILGQQTYFALLKPGAGSAERS
jgi:hypothetical protein